MGIMTTAGRAALARAVKEQSIFLALGSGDGEWGDIPPVEDFEAAALQNEVGRRILSRALFVYPDDENGTLSVPLNITYELDGTATVAEQKYSVSDTPTRYLYLEFALDFEDAANVTVRELGIYIGAKLRLDAQNSGKMFFRKEDFNDEGILFLLENREPMLRKAEIRDSFEWVIPF